ncbi:MAG TPA: urease accessory protein UreE [Steroidobacteraceae bacterium]|jgi:urease accessory protein
MSTPTFAPLTRVAEILRNGRWPLETAADSVRLTYDERHRRRLRYIGDRGTVFLLDLPRATVLHAGDGLKLEDGRIVRVDASPESLVEITAPDAHTLVRLAWHVGNRHIPAQLEASRLVIRYDSVIVGMVVGLGAAVRTFSGEFTPEPGAYDDSNGGGEAHDRRGGADTHHPHVFAGHQHDH